MGKRKKLWFKRVVKWAFLLIILLLGSTTLLHFTYFSQQRKKVEPYGQMVPVFDGTMHLTTMGKGEETIVLLPGMGVALPSADFGPLMRELGKKHTVVVVEYFGVGFSSQTNRERTSANYVEEIRTALRTAGFTAPYLLVAHSISSLYSEYYASAYPDEVKAIVSLDGTSSDFYTKTPGFVAALLPIAKLQQTLGVAALLGPLVTNRKEALELGYTDEEIDHMLLFAGFSINDTLLEQIAQGTEFVAQTKALAYPESVPYYKVISKDTYEKPNKQLPMTPQEYQMQHLKRIGPQAEYEVLEGTHFIYQTNVNRIAEIVNEMVKK
jgi:pimeloyl-ACP methyl ester carboxylesterase